LEPFLFKKGRPWVIITFFIMVVGMLVYGTSLMKNNQTNLSSRDE